MLKRGCRIVMNDEKKRKLGDFVNVKAVYAFVLVAALTVALTAKFASDNKKLVSLEEQSTEKNVPYVFTTSFERANDNVTNVPDTRNSMPLTEQEAPLPETAAVTEEPTLFAAAKPYEGYYALPLGTDTGKPFSDTAPVYSQTMGDWRAHNGTDFFGAEGDRVGAIAAGKVIDVTNDAMLGTVVSVDHGNGVTARYCGLKSDGAPEVGSVIRINDTVGYLGTVPCEATEGAHLHLEIKVDGVYRDPVAVMAKGEGE